MDTLFKVFLTLLLIAINAFFVVAEFGAVAARQSRLETAAKTSFFARLSLGIKQRLELYLASCQLGLTGASLALGAVMEPLTESLLHPLLHSLGDAAKNAISLTVSFLVIVSLHIVIGEQAPKYLSIRHPERALSLTCLPLILFTKLCYPLIWTLTWLTNGVLRVLGMQATGHGNAHSADELKTLLAEAVSTGSIAKQQGKLLSGALEFEELRARQIMTPRPRVTFLNVGDPIGKMLRTVQKSGYSRMPLCRGDLDHVIGVVHMKDLFNVLKLVPGKLRFGDSKTEQGEEIFIADGKPGSTVHVIGSGDIDLAAIRRDVLFVPETLAVPKLLRQFQTSNIHLAVVVDEYGATQGVVTLEDVLEEIVGEIQDEFDARGGDGGFKKEGANFRVAGTFPLHELRERLSLEDDLDFADIDTVNGYVIRELGRFPVNGDTIPLGQYTLRVLGAQHKRVTQALVMPNTPPSENGNGTDASTK